MIQYSPLKVFLEATIESFPWWGLSCQSLSFVQRLWVSYQVMSSTRSQLYFKFVFGSVCRIHFDHCICQSSHLPQLEFHTGNQISASVVLSHRTRGGPTGHAKKSQSSPDIFVEFDNFLKKINECHASIKFKYEASRTEKKIHETTVLKVENWVPILAFKRNKNLWDIIGCNNVFDNKNILNVKKFNKRKYRPYFSKFINLSNLLPNLLNLSKSL